MNANIEEMNNVEELIRCGIPYINRPCNKILDHDANNNEQYDDDQYVGLDDVEKTYIINLYILNVIQCIIMVILL